MEAGPLSQWLVNGLAEAGLPMICVETRHMKAVLKTLQANKSERNDSQPQVVEGGSIRDARLAPKQRTFRN